MLVRYTYIVFLGVLIATFVALGIDAFYPAPKPPQDRPVPQRFYDEKPSATEAAEIDKQVAENQRRYDAFNDQMKLHNRNVSIISLVSSLIILVVGLTVVYKTSIISDGMVLGGVLTLLYSIVRGFNAGDSMFRFLVASAGLLVALTLGYLKFVKPSLKK